MHALLSREADSGSRPGALPAALLDDLPPAGQHAKYTLLSIRWSFSLSWTEGTLEAKVV